MRRLIDPIELKRSIAVSNMIGDGKTLEELIDEQPDAQTNAESTQDLISRQALCEYALNQKNKSVTPNDIMRFPSAQPDLSSYSDKLWRAAYERGKAEAQPQRMRGRWINDAKTYYEMLIKKGLSIDAYTPYFMDDIACSECLAKYSVIDNETQFFKYCPNCGARMDGGES